MAGQYDFTVYFNQSIGGVTSVSSGSLQAEMSDVFLDVESLYGRYDFAIETAQQFDWQRYQSVLVTLRYRHRQQPNSSVSRSFQLDQTSPRAHYPVMLPEPDEYQFDVNKPTAPPSTHRIFPPAENRPAGRLPVLDPVSPARADAVGRHGLAPGGNGHRFRQLRLHAGGNAAAGVSIYRIDAAPRCFSADQLDPEQMSVELDIWFTYQPGEGGDRPKRAVLDRRQRFSPPSVN